MVGNKMDWYLIGKLLVEIMLDGYMLLMEKSSLIIEHELGNVFIIQMK